MAGELCDVCGAEPGQYALTDRDTGLTQFIGPNCLALLGFTMQMQADRDVVDALLRDSGYAVTKREKDRRKAELEPEFDTGRTIAEVVETAPRDEQDEAADDDDDMGGTDKGRHDATSMVDAPDVAEPHVEPQPVDVGNGEARPDAGDPAPY